MEVGIALLLFKCKHVCVVIDALYANNIMYTLELILPIQFY